MKLLTFRKENDLHLGIKLEKGILDVAKAAKHFNITAPITMEQVLENTAQAEMNLRDLISKATGSDTFFVDEENLNFGPTAPNPSKIICVGLNYRKHAKESNMPVPESPILFNKFNNTISANGDIVQLPFNSNQVDYEAELGIVIGKKTKRVTREDAKDYIFGYTAVNDLSSRDLQFKTHQWLLGKSLDGFSPVGPYLVTSEEVGNPNQLGIRTYVNGEIRQNSNTSDMVFDCYELVSYISQYMTLEPGDLILTGTPEGVVFGYPEDKQVWLQDGDEVIIEIDKLGRLVNRMRQEV